jgi:hypothetical protein
VEPVNGDRNASEFQELSNVFFLGHISQLPLLIIKLAAIYYLNYLYLGFCHPTDSRGLPHAYVQPSALMCLSQSLGE